MPNDFRLALAAVALIFAASGSAADERVLSYGKGLVEKNCSACHATGPAGDSPLAGAPAFRDLSKRYPIDALEEAFAEGIVTGHPGMPEFEATPEQIEAILAYLDSIQAK